MECAQLDYGCTHGRRWDASDRCHFVRYSCLQRNVVIGECLMNIKENIPLNFELLGNPVNWVIVLLMIAIAGLAVNVIFSEPKTGDV
jgi:hypothetical protein